MSTLLKDLIDIPETAGADDYVLKLTDGVENQDRMIADYVVTDDLRNAFDLALTLVTSAMGENASKAAFLDGSFGSGKSHFMGVLYSILEGNPRALELPALAPVVAKHEPRLHGKKVLNLAYHLLNIKSVEDAILGGYVEQIRRLHPTCVLPAVHQTDKILANAENQRLNLLGDDTFFAKLSAGGAEVDDEWGEFGTGGTTWTLTTYLDALHSPEGDAKRTQLVTDYLRVYEPHSLTTGRDYLPLSEGLQAITAHAKSLGYSAIVMFCDELILRLINLVSDVKSFQREVTKITGFVEDGSGARAIPLVAILARQLDLRAYFNDKAGVTGSEQHMISTAFSTQEGRFAKITLGNNNLPEVIHKRLLTPKTAEAAREIKAALASATKRHDVRDVMLDAVGGVAGEEAGTMEQFELTYPFSPALITTLQALAGVMQRNRTAIKVMQRLLVEKRETLKVTDVIPVGDLYDIIMTGSDPIDGAAKKTFDRARTVYDNKFAPQIAADENTNDVVATRIAKTIVLSTITDVKALRNLTPRRVAALNHGTIKTPLVEGIPNRVLAEVKKWLPHVPELKLSEISANGQITLTLTDIDYEYVIDAARSEDNYARRRTLIRNLLCAEFGVSDAGTIDGALTRKVLWRGTERVVTVVFGNICDPSELTDMQFQSPDDEWRIVVDYPFDESGRSHRDDLQRLEALSARFTSINTLVWLPRFFTTERLDSLGKLAICEHVLGGVTLDSYTQTKSSAEKKEIRALLEQQRDALRHQLGDIVRQAYGLDRETAGSIVLDEEHSGHLKSLNPGCSVQKPVGTTMGQAFDQLVTLAFDALYPSHPKFARTFRRGELDLAAKTLRLAALNEDGRVGVNPSEIRVLREILNPLKAGHATEDGVLLTTNTLSDWNDAFSKGMGAHGLGNRDTIDLGRARAWVTATPRGRGLPEWAQDLVIIAWALSQQRSFYRGGVALTELPTPGKLDTSMSLVQAALPERAAYQRAVGIAGALFGLHVSDYLTAPSLTELATGLKTRAQASRDTLNTYVNALVDAYARLGVRSGDRLDNAQATLALIDDIVRLEAPISLVDAVAEFEMPHTYEASARAISSAADAVTALSHLEWANVQFAMEQALADPTESVAGDLEAFRSALKAVELATRLKPATDTLKAALSGWMRERAKPIVAAPTPPPAPVDPLPGGHGQLPAGHGQLPAGHDRPAAVPTPVAPPPAEPSVRQKYVVAEPDNESRREALDELARFLHTTRGKRVRITYEVIE